MQSMQHQIRRYRLQLIIFLGYQEKMTTSFRVYIPTSKFWKLEVLQILGNLKINFWRFFMKTFYFSARVFHVWLCPCCAPPGSFPANIYLFKVSSRNTRKKCEVCSKLTKRIPRQYRSGVFIVNFKNISHFFLVFLWLTVNR